MAPRLAAIVALLVAAVPIVPARAATRLCVDVRAAESEIKNLQKLVLDELGHHPTHAVVEKDCQSVLAVELFEVKKVLYLTARVNQEIPVRHEIEEKEELAENLSDALRQVLSHDPVYLSDDITHYSALQRAAHSVLKRGHNVWRIELYQGLGRGGGSAAMAPGGAVSVTRGADHWRVYTRIYFGGWPGEVGGGDVALRVCTGADVGLTFELSALADWTFYASAGLGLQYLRYEGRTVADDPDSVDHRNDFGPSFHLRIGLRFLRTNDFDFDVFVLGYLPMFPADVDTRLDDFYPPTLQAGVGVGF